MGLRLFQRVEESHPASPPLSEQLRELRALGFPERGPALQALYQNNGDIWRALAQLQRLRLEPFHQRLWESEEPPIDFHSPDRQVSDARLSCLCWIRPRAII